MNFAIIAESDKDKKNSSNAKDDFFASHKQWQLPNRNG